MNVLTGWKQIAAHMHSAVRTVQRREAIGLPIHRLSTGTRGTVTAFAEELDTWVGAAPARLVCEMNELKANVESLKTEVRRLKQELKREQRKNLVKNTSMNALP